MGPDGIRWESLPPILWLAISVLFVLACWAGCWWAIFGDDMQAVFRRRPRDAADEFDDGA